MKFLATFAFLFVSSAMAKFNFNRVVKTEFMSRSSEFFISQSADFIPNDIDYIDVGAATNFSWYDYNAVSPVQDQTNHCMGGYIFAAVAAIESQMLIKNAKYQKLSEQEVLDCMPYGCFGGDMEGVFNFSTKYSGIAASKDYPYAGYVKGRCEDAKNRKPVANTTVLKIYRGKLSPELIIQAGPVGLDMSVYENFLTYKGGIYSYASGRALFVHSVLIIGYGKDKNNQPFYLGKNSWGTGWGENGFFKIAANKNILEIVNQEVMFPTLAFIKKSSSRRV